MTFTELHIQREIERSIEHHRRELWGLRADRRYLPPDWYERGRRYHLYCLTQLRRITNQ